MVYHSVCSEPLFHGHVLFDNTRRHHKMLESTEGVSEYRTSCGMRRPCSDCIVEPPFGKQRRTLAPCGRALAGEPAPRSEILFQDHDNDKGHLVLCRCYQMPRLLPIGARGPFAVAIATEHIRTAVAGKDASPEPQAEELWPLEIMAQVRKVVLRSVSLAEQSKC